MYIESLSLRNFRCFGDTVTTIKILPGTTGFVGDNGAGKTSVVDALKRLFSPLSVDRQLRKSDVHFGPGEDSQNIERREIVIDVVFGFSDTASIPQVFNDIFFNAKDESMKVRIVFEGLYRRLVSYEDDIEVKFYSLRTLDEVPFGPDDERKTPLRARPTQFAEMVYIPAHRDSVGVTRSALKNLLKHLERFADWDVKTKNKSQNFAKKLEKSLNKVTAIETITADLTTFWRSLHDGSYEAEPHIGVVATEFEQLVRDLTLRFGESPTGGQRNFDELSEGQISLIYFALSATLHSLIRKMDSPEGTSGFKGFKPLGFVPAPLKIFALEEPENHLAPFYLPRLVSLLAELNRKGAAQSFVTSHSASVVRHICPRSIRYFRYCRKLLVSHVNELSIPEHESEEFKFLHQVIQTNPEIYFARLVIIGEGGSEQIVIPRIAKAFGLNMDPSFVAFVPIGGRHAKYLWKLVDDLKIPCLTLLDFDLGRHGGGMGRVREAANWLNSIGHDIKVSESVSNDNLNKDALDHCIDKLRENGVFYSTYLDLDMMMLIAFSEAYQPISEFAKAKTSPENMSKAVFGEKGDGNALLGKIEAEISHKELFTYNNLFKSRSKLASHFKAMASLDCETIKANCPEPLKALINEAKLMLSPLSSKENEAEE